MPYFWSFVFFFLSAVPLTDVAAPVIPWGDMKIMHTWHDIPVNWETLGHPSAGSTMDLHIVLEPDLENALIDALSEISNPNHSRYRAFLSKEQVNELVRPSSETVELVCAWLAHNGIPSSSISRTHGGTWLTITDVRISQASQLLGASYQLYRNLKTNDTIIRTVGYSLPRVLHTHVQTIMPTACFTSMEVTVQTPHRRSIGPAPAQMQAASGKLGTAQARQPPPESPIEVPGDLRWIYGTVEYVPAAFQPGKNTLAVVGDRLPRRQDLTAFMDDFQTEHAAGADFNIVPVAGNLLNPFEELPDEKSSVAVQYATFMAYPTPLFVYRIARTPEAFQGFIQIMLGMNPPPRTIGISFNFFLEPNIPPTESNFMCALLSQFGVRGISVLVASGDNGVGAGECEMFRTEFPSSCPWITSVGGTQGLNPEIAAPFSGGGFSRRSQRPEYQRTVIPDFLVAAGSENLGRYNPFGRGYPDISAQAVGCQFYLDGVASVMSSTACAVSTAAGIISLLNDYMISTRPANEDPNEAPLGFLNPWLYSNEVRTHKGLKDIVQGKNPGCGTEGFEAREGWDPVTGLGTLNFPNLKYILQRRRFLDLRPTRVPTPGAMVSVPPPTQT